MDAVVNLAFNHDWSKFAQNAADEIKAIKALGSVLDAGPLRDVARLYRLALEKTGTGMTAYHAVQEVGVPLRNIAETVGKGLKLPVVSIPAAKAAEHFGMFAHFATLDMPASSAWPRNMLGWEPTGPGLIEDLEKMNY